MRYTESHEWIKVEGNVGTVGITQYAQKELGEVVYIELPKVGRFVNANDEISILESTKAAADVYAPVSGNILEINEALKKEPSLINQDPEKKGWLFRIEISNPKELERLYNEEEYRRVTQ